MNLIRSFIESYCASSSSCAEARSSLDFSTLADKSSIWLEVLSSSLLKEDNWPFKSFNSPFKPEVVLSNSSVEGAEYTGVLTEAIVTVQMVIAKADRNARFFFILIINISFPFSRMRIYYTTKHKIKQIFDRKHKKRQKFFVSFDRLKVFKTLYKQIRKRFTQRRFVYKINNENV